MCFFLSTFPLSDVMITPCNRNEVEADPNKALFNIRQSGARVEMTENIYGIWSDHKALGTFVLAFSLSVSISIYS